AGFITTVDRIKREYEIAGDELGRIGIIGVNASDLGRCNDYYVGLHRSQKLFRLVLAFEIDLLATDCDHVVAIGTKTTNDRRADHAAVPGNINSLPGKIKDLGGHRTMLYRHIFSLSTTPADALVPDDAHIRFHHFYHQLIEACPVVPAKVDSRLAWITNQSIHFGRAEITRVDFHEHFPSRFIEAFLLDAVSAPDDRSADVGESLFNEFAHRMCFTGCKHVVVRFLLLEDQPHPLYKITRVSPIARGVKISKKQLLL